MASEKQIAANRANAKRSTGPKTLAGKLKSSRNAYRHGLSIPSSLNHAPALQKLETLILALVDDQSSPKQAQAANQIAKAHLELLRVRSKRAEFLAKVDIVNGDAANLKRLAAFDRYENLAQAERRRGIKCL
jgi:hypothetical protein